MKSNLIRLRIASFTLAVMTSCTAPVASTTALPTATLSPVPVSTTEAPSATPSFTPLPTSTSLSSETPTSTTTMTPGISPTAVTLRGEMLELSSCRYGPGEPYLYKYGLRKGTPMEIIGRREDAKWVYVQAIGGHNPCWINAKLIQSEGDVMSLQIYYPEKAPLPQSPYYSPTIMRSATRNGSQVTVEWTDVPLRAGDEEDEFMQHYIIEVWRCEGGGIIFEPLATNDLSISFVDEAGCGAPSHGRIFVQEKHGFSGPTEIPWPPYQ